MSDIYVPAALTGEAITSNKSASLQGWPVFSEKFQMKGCIKDFSSRNYQVYSVTVKYPLMPHGIQSLKIICSKDSGTMIKKAGSLIKGIFTL